MPVDLWIEKYRPSTLDGYVFKNEAMQAQVSEWVKNTDNKTIPIPNLLLSGAPGTGKTTLARALVNVLGVAKGDLLEINASRENKVDDVRTKIVNFCETWPIGEYKVIILDEVDGFSQAAQMILRAEIEKHSDTARFILTCNYPNKIIPALHSRLQGYHIDALDLESFIGRVLTILEAENISFEMDQIDQFIQKSYPDLRRCINLLDQNCRNGVLHAPEEVIESSFDYLEEAVTLFKNREFTQARKLITSRASPEDYEEIYKYFYKNLPLFAKSETGQDQAILAIAKGLKNHALVADPEINLAATLVELSMIEG